MSSILRALKKLENEPRHLDENLPLESKFIAFADTAPERTFSRIFMMMLGGGIICGLVILAGWWLFSEKFQPRSTASQTATQPHSRLNESFAPSNALDRTQSNSAVSEIPAKASVEAAAIQERTEQITKEPKPASIDESSFGTIIQEDISAVEQKTPGKTLPAQVPPGLKTNEQVNLPAKKTVAASFSPPASPAKTAEVEIPRLNDPDMKLQAITWSRVPQKRIAVINNRILREGETVSGYFINTINQDDVVLSQEGKKWKIFFR